jgi:hypothetical protein
MGTTAIYGPATHQERFLQRIVAHHRAGNHYPDPWLIGQEARLTHAQTAAVLDHLRAIGWVAASPYGPERLRLTPRCWDILRRASQPRLMRAPDAA